MLSSVDSTEGGGATSIERSQTPENTSATDSFSSSTSPSGESLQNSSGSQSYLSTDASDSQTDSRVSQASYLALSKACDYDAYNGQSTAPRAESIPKDDDSSPKYTTLKPATVVSTMPTTSMGMMPSAGYPRMPQYARTSPTLHQQAYQPAGQMLSAPQMYSSQAEHLPSGYAAQHQYGAPSTLQMPPSGAPPPAIGAPTLSPSQPLVDNSSGPGYSSNGHGAAVYLCNRDLWTRFHTHTTEMIITKQGRSVDNHNIYILLLYGMKIRALTPFILFSPKISSY